MGIFIAVVAVLILLNLFFVFIIRALGARIGNFAQSNMLRQSSVFDELILRKEETLQGLLGSIESAESRLRDITETVQIQTDYGVPMEHHAVIPGNYMDPDFAKTYKDIRENFIFDKTELLRKLTKYFKDEQEDALTLAAKRIVDSIDADACYQLSTLTSDEQIDILNSVFDSEQNELIQEYATDHTQFESFEFVAWLKEYIFRRGNEIYVRTGLRSDNFDAVDSRVITEYDDALIEGLYVIHKGTMYDYSIKGKEISG